MAVGSIDLGAAVILVYNEGTTRFDDVPSMDNFGPRIPEEVKVAEVALVDLYSL